MKLFDAVVTSTLLYGSETWTLRLDQQRRLQVLQRKMLRMVLNAKRRTITTSSSSESDVPEDESEADNLEPWPEFLARSAGLAEEKLEDAGQEEWLDQWRRKQWRWAARLATSGKHKWAFKTFGVESYAAF